MCLPKLLWCVHVLFTTSRCHYAYLCYFCCLHLLTTSNLPTLLCLQTGESRPSDRCTPTAAQPALHHRRPPVHLPTLTTIITITITSPPHTARTIGGVIQNARGSGNAL